MQAVLSLLLPCILAQVWLVPSSTPGPYSQEAQEALETLTTPRAQTNISEAMRAPEEEEKMVEGEEEDAPWLTAKGQKLSRETSNLGFSLLRKISMRHDGNVVFSPLGLSWAMAALTLGSRRQSRPQLERGLRLQALNQTLSSVNQTLSSVNQTRPAHLPALFKQLRERLFPSPELGLAQGSLAFIHEDFDVKETFLNFSKRYFDTKCVTINFRNASQAKGLMNHYINKETQGKLPKLFDEINPDTKLILVDYILLKGKWLTPFDPVHTEMDTFYLDKYKAVKVPMMYRAGKFASTFDKNFRCHVLKLPYRGNATMLVVLVERIGDHLALEDYLTADLVDTWLRNMKIRKMEVFFPKFKLDQKYKMHELLKQMGIRRLFSRWADLSDLSVTERNLKVAKVLQRAMIEVDEEGTEAVAGTLSEITAYSMPPIIKVDRPFHFIIYEETSRILLFLGRVLNPTLP
ncbi:protein Z-dependent protease inhibitor [Hippopotamus amphibius kiboko]|uniref:protein Z-dependent protease inhibitor n=1 Tax=Hippopotamus amphibius kiboko TaxID=575201 RepID=UPI002597E52B|nr:protein Z-dependent protease inhibitor [Hippopotamus amphibius kiboko]